jgi:fatty-acyl-CoA synthase
MDPRGGLTPMSRRVMNLAHFLTQNARRHGVRVGFIWGDRSWTWREIDGHVSALAAARARGIVKGDRILVHSRIATRCSGRCFRRSGSVRSGCRPISG